MDLPDDFIAIESHSRLQQRRQRQCRHLSQNVGRGRVGQCLDPDDLHGEIVRAALSVRLFDDRPRGTIQIFRMAADRIDHGAWIHMLVDAVGSQNKGVSQFDRQHLIVDFDLRPHSQGAAEVDFLRRHEDPMVVGELFEGVAGHAVDTRVTDMDDMRGPRFEDQDGHRAHMPLVPVMWMLAAAGL